MTERDELANDVPRTVRSEPASGANRSVRKDVARNRARLLEAADKLVADSGLELSLNELAKRAGVGVGTVYRHFADKEAVLSALFEQRLDAIAAVFREAGGHEDPIVGLRHVLYTLGEMQAGDRALFQVMAATKSPKHRAMVRDRLEPLARTLVERAKATGRIRPEFAPTDIPMLLWVSMSVNDYSGGVRPDLWRRYIEVALDGFAAEGQPRQPLTVNPLASDDMETAITGWHQR
jgi:AcrR family transcriptional regulator